MSISTIIPSILNPLTNRRVWESATPDDLDRDANGDLLPFIIFNQMGGMDSEYVDQTMPSHSHARVQVTVFHPDPITADQLIRAAVDRMLASVYPVGVYGSPVGTYDAARKLFGRFVQFSIHYPRT